MVGALEPSEQANGMEGVLAGGTSLVWSLHISRYDRVANGTLALSLQSTLHVPPECQEAINEVTVGKHDDSLNCEEPILPLLLIHKHPATADHQCGVKRVCWWERNRNRDWG